LVSGIGETIQLSEDVVDDEKLWCGRNARTNHGEGGFS